MSTVSRRRTMKRSRAWRSSRVRRGALSVKRAHLLVLVGAMAAALLPAPAARADHQFDALQVELESAMRFPRGDGTYDWDIRGRVNGPCVHCARYVFVEYKVAGRTWRTAGYSYPGIQPSPPPSRGSAEGFKIVAVDRISVPMCTASPSTATTRILEHKRPSISRAVVTRSHNRMHV